MARRRLSERQLERIAGQQERRRARVEARAEAALADADDQPRAGRVVVRHGANLAVEDDGGAVFHCVSRQNLGHLVCGDRVIWQPTGDQVGVVTALLPRTTVLSRPDFAGRDKPLAANLTLFVIVIAPRPAPVGHLLDQYLVSAELIGVAALIAVTKMDLLPDPDARAAFLGGLDTYARIGYPLLPLSIHEDPLATALRDRLDGHTTILLGQSGVGKSSLVKALLPDQAVQIGRLSQATGLGRHTTSAATCYRVGANASLIDSPGVRSFRLGPLDRDTLARGFREFAPWLGKCRFTDCAHLHEPDCALRAAVTTGLIPSERLATFHALAAESASRPT